jgi:hypothetical protein
MEDVVDEVAAVADDAVPAARPVAITSAAVSETMRRLVT